MNSRPLQKFFRDIQTHLRCQKVTEEAKENKNQGYAHLNISLFLYVLPHIRYILLINIIISLSLKKEYQFYFLLSVTICFTEELGFLSSSLKNVG